MKRLIVNADDLGASPGVTRGILEAHARGIVTSASLMVETAWSEEAAALSRSAPRLGIGLHLVLEAAGEGGTAEALRRQVGRFMALMGRLPTHLDSHHNLHRSPRHLGPCRALAAEIGVRLRGDPPVRCFPGFYGRWAGASHPEHVSFESLARMLAIEVGEGVTELSCHPGRVDRHLASDYAAEREVELETLCDPRLPATLATLGIALASFADLRRPAAATAGGA